MNPSALLQNWSRDCLSIPKGCNDGSLARSAWKRRTHGSVPLGYGLRFSPVNRELMRALSDGCRCAATRSYRTLRDGFTALLFPGTSCQATIRLSLRDRRLRFPTARVEERSYDRTH